MATWLRTKVMNLVDSKEPEDTAPSEGALVTVDELRPREDTLGLHVLYEPREDPIIADVVAVHGLGGDSFSTWTAFSNVNPKEHKLWLRDFLPKEKYFSQTRIMTFGYDGRAWFTAKDKSSSKRTFVFAGDLLVALQNNRVLTGALGRPIMFIGHSLGGIVVKKAIVTAHESRFESHPLGGLYWDIYESAKAFVFFGTPHQGSDAAVWARYLGFVAKVVGVSKSESVNELATWSPSLVQVAIYFSTHVCRPGVHLVTFFETLPYNGVQVVNEAAATLNYAHEVRAGLNENHRTICKFASASSSTYRLVVPTMQTVVKALAESAQRKLTESNPVEDAVFPVSFPTAPTKEPGASKSAHKEDVEERWKHFPRQNSS